MDFRILGPLEVVDGDAAVPLAGVKQRALLALFLLNANQVVSSDRLVEELWAGRSPESARAALQVRVSQLRKALGAGGAAIITRPPGYLVRVGRDELDLHRFELLVSEADAAGPAVAAAKLREALALWRGPPLADISYEAFAQNAIRRLEELRLAALEKRIDADLTLGRHADLIAELETLVAEQPLRESLRGQLMLALYRCGRQADALAAYQSARRVLVEELGIEPSPPLRELEQAILHQDPTLSAPRRAARGTSEFESAPPGSSALRDVVAPPIGVMDAMLDGNQLQVPASRRLVVTALSCRVTGFTAAGEELDAEALLEVVNPYLAVMPGLIGGHGGTVARAMGDAVTAVFGFPGRREDDAIRAVRVAVEMRARLALLDSEVAGRSGIAVHSRIGVSTGAVVVGHSEGVQGLVGGALNMAARLEQAAQAGEILMGRDTYRLVRGHVRADPVGALALDGKTEPIQVFRLTDLVDGGDELGRSLSSPMVGRDRELDVLQAAFSEMLDRGTRRQVLVLGPAGIGKSRLAREFVEGLGDRARVLRGRCLAYGEGLTYWPVTEIVRDAANIGESDGREVALEKLAAVVRDGDDFSFMLDRLGGILGFNSDDGHREETFWAVRRFLEAVAVSRPVVAVLDDVHWGAPSLIELLDYLGERVEGRVMVVALARPDGGERRLAVGTDRVDRVCVRLEPLDAVASRRLIAALLEQVELDIELTERITEAAGGNPLFVEEMLRMLVDDGYLQRDRDGWRSSGNVHSAQVPPTIEALLGARLDRLTEGERATVERAAVVGKLFWRGALVELSPLDARARLDFDLDSLVAKDLIAPDVSGWSDDVAFRFEHVLVRDVAYSTMLKRTRAQLHERVADWLEKKTGARRVEYGELAGYHLEQAYRLRMQLGTLAEDDRALALRAAEHLGAAGRRAAARGDVPGACELLERAITLLPEDVEERLDLSLRHGIALRESGSLSGAAEVLAETVRAAGKRGDRGLEYRALIEQAILIGLTDQQADLGAAAELAHRAVATFEELGDEIGLAKAWRLLSLPSGVGEHLGEAAEMLLRALGHARKAEDRREADEILEWLTMVHFLGPARAEDAIPPMQALVDANEDDRPGQAALLVLRAAFAAMAGEFAQARELLDRGIHTLDEIGLSFMRGVYGLIAGAVESWAGNGEAAEAHWKAGLASQLQMGGTGWAPTYAASLSRSLIARGRISQATRYARVLKDAGRADDVRKQIDSRMVEGQLLARKGHLDAAEQLMRDGVELLARSGTDSHNLRGDTVLTLATLLAQRGKHGEAAEVAREARAAYEAKGNKVGAATADALLQSLST